MFKSIKKIHRSKRKNHSLMDPKTILILLLCIQQYTIYKQARAFAAEFHCKATPKQELLQRIIEQLKLLRTVDVISNETELKGTDRVAVDGICNQEQCETLFELAKKFAVDGDGYDGNVSPHSMHEIFKGVTLGYAALLVYHGVLPMQELELFLNLVTKAVNIVERHFNLPTELHLDYTQLACREEKEDAPVNRNNFRDLSHLVHADNCDLQPNGTCLKTSAELSKRDYSAVLYLNNDFEGGEFFFTNNLKEPQTYIKPRCGRLVAFSSGGENPHGVTGVKRGMRCAMGLWMTLDPSKEAEERKLATQLLKIMKTGGPDAVPEDFISSFPPYVRLNTKQHLEKVKIS